MNTILQLKVKEIDLTTKINCLNARLENTNSKTDEHLYNALKIECSGLRFKRIRVKTQISKLYHI